jgi:hypothetical protein
MLTRDDSGGFQRAVVRSGHIGHMGQRIIYLVWVHHADGHRVDQFVSEDVLQ